MMTLKRILNFVKENVIVEPLLIFINITILLSDNAYYNLRLHKSFLLVSKNGTTDNVHKLAVNYLHQKLYWEPPLATIAVFIASIIFTTMSDKLKMRKPFLLLTYYGELLLSATYFLFAIFLDKIPLEVVAVVNIITKLCGSLPLMWATVISYITDMTTTEQRTPRILFLYVVLHLSGPISYSYYQYFAHREHQDSLEIFLVIILTVLVIIYIKIRLVEENSIRDIDIKWKELVRLRALWNSSKKLFKKDIIGIFMCALVYFVIMFVETGEPPMWKYRYAKTYLSFTANDLDDIFLYENTVRIIVASYFLWQYPIDDHILLGLTSLDKVIGSIILFFVTNKREFYYSLFFHATFIINVPILISLATKVVSSENTAKAQLIFYIRDILITVLLKWSLPFYNLIFKATKESHPTAFLYVSVAFYLSTIPLIFCSYFTIKKKNRVSVLFENSRHHAVVNHM